MYRFGQNSEGYEKITVSHYRVQCINLYCLYIRSKYMYHLQEHTIRTSSPMKGLSLRYDEEWYNPNPLHKYRRANNPPKFWSPSTFGIIWSHTTGWSPFRLIVGSQVQRLCRSQESAEARGKKICKDRAVFDCVSDVTLSLYVWFCASERLMEQIRMILWGQFRNNIFEITVT